jgi:hypothetical protein
MAKFRWFNASLTISLEELTSALRKVPFLPEEEDSEGFRIQEKTRSSVHAQYIEKESFLETIALPTGHEIEESRVKIRVTDFHITRDHHLSLQLVNPPRTLTPFFNALSDATVLSFAFEPIECNLMDWIGYLQEEAPGLEVVNLECSGVRISALTQARMAITGPRDVRKDFHKFLGNKEVSFEKAKCLITSEGMAISVELFKTGAAKITSPFSDDIVSLLKRSLKRTLP